MSNKLIIKMTEKEFKCKCGHNLFEHHHFVNDVEGYTGGGSCNKCYCEEWEDLDKPKVVILDDNELSIMKYAEEYPENWERICKALEEKK